MIRNFVHILILLNFVQRIFGYSQSIIDMSIDIVETYGNMNIRIWKVKCLVYWFDENERKREREKSKLTNVFVTQRLISYIRYERIDVMRAMKHQKKRKRKIPTCTNIYNDYIWWWCLVKDAYCHLLSCSFSFFFFFFASYNRWDPSSDVMCLICFRTQEMISKKCFYTLFVLYIDSLLDGLYVIEYQGYRGWWEKFCICEYQIKKKRAEAFNKIYVWWVRAVVLWLSSTKKHAYISI